MCILHLENRDFIPLRETVVFTEAGVKCVNVSIVTGNVVEYDEHFTVVLTSHDDRLEVKEYYIPVYIEDSDCEYYNACDQHYLVDQLLVLAIFANLTHNCITCDSISVCVFRELVHF